MADKKTIKHDENMTSSRPEKTESPADFLARVGVTRQMQDVISIILENRPDDPVAYIADYFANITEHISYVTKAHQHLCLSHHSQPAYENNLLKAFTVLNNQKLSQGLKGLNGKLYNELLVILCRHIPSNEADTLLKMLQKRDQDIVTFNDFTSGVTCCFLFKDFISEAKSVFHELDLSGRGHADYALCVAMLSQLTTAVTRTKDNSGLRKEEKRLILSNNMRTLWKRILEAGVSLSTPNIRIAMRKALSDSFTHNSGKTMSLDEFVHQAGKIFFLKVPTSKTR